MLSVALAILLAIKKQVLKWCQSRIPSAESSEVLTQTRMAQMNFWLLTSGYLTSERKEVLKSILIYLLAPFLCRYLLKNKNSFLFFFFSFWWEACPNLLFTEAQQKLVALCTGTSDPLWKQIIFSWFINLPVNPTWRADNSSVWITETTCCRNKATAR